MRRFGAKIYIVVAVLLSVATILPSLLFGAVHPEILAFFGAWSGVMFMALAVWGHKMGTISVDLPGGLLLVMIGATVFQLIPLPAPLVSFFSPGAFEIRTGAFDALGHPHGFFMPLTLDVTLTAMELSKLLFYLSVYWLSIAWVKRSGSALLIKLVLVTTGLCAAIYLFHKILMLDQIYGFFTPIHRGFNKETLCAPLVNANHLAGLLGIGATLSIGQALARQDKLERILVICLAALLGGCLLLTLSRGGIAAFVVGQIVFIVLRVLSGNFKKYSGEPSSFLLWLPLGLVLSLGLGLFVGYDAIVTEFLEGDQKKVEIVTESLPLIKQFWLTGVGRGAFWVGFPQVSDWSAIATFTHAENVFVQLLSDFGVIIGSIVLIGSLVFLGNNLLRPPARVHKTAVIAALSLLAVHNLVDFNLEIPAVGVLMAILTAILAVRQQSNPSGHTAKSAMGLKGAVAQKFWMAAQKLRIKVAPAFLVVPGLVSMGLCVYLVTVVSKHHLDKDEIAFRQAFQKQNHAAFESEALLTLFGRHPAAGYFPFLAGVYQYEFHNKAPLVLFSRALKLNPSMGAAHFYAGRTLLRLKRLDQALIEFRVAGKIKKSLVLKGARALVLSGADFSDLKNFPSAVDSESEKALFWSALATVYAQQKRDGQSELADLAVIGLKEALPSSLSRQARRYLHRREIEQALGLAERLEKMSDYKIDGMMLKSDIYEKSGNYPASRAILKQAAAEATSRLDVLRRLAWSYQRSKDTRTAQLYGKQYVENAATVIQKSEGWILKGDLALNAGRVLPALGFYQKAVSFVPTNLRLLKKIADIGQKHGENIQALDALRRMVDLEPTNREWVKRYHQLQRNVSMGLTGKKR